MNRRPTVEEISYAKDKRILGPQSPNEEAVFAYEARIVDLENEVGKRDKRIAELEAKLARAVAFVQSLVGGRVYTAADYFTKPHESETSRQAHATLEELKAKP